MSTFDISRVLSGLTEQPPVISGPDIFRVLELSKQILIKEPNMLLLSDPLIVVGDIHGQLYDMLEIFRIEPPPPASTYLFLGDYVDRGYYSMEVLIYLLCLKIQFPSQVYLLRGNHETQAVTRTYGFYEECCTKFKDATIYDACLDLFNYLPFAALINKRIFAVHGGLSPSMHLLDQIPAADRFQEPVTSTLMSDVLWGDPGSTEASAGFQASRRGAGYVFGGDITRRFAALNRVSHITRAHQLAMQGYDFCFGGLLSTVWSAPNYMYRAGNLASVMRVSHTESEFGLWFNVFGPVPAGERTVPVTKDTVSPYFL